VSRIIAAIVLVAAGALIGLAIAQQTDDEPEVLASPAAADVDGDGEGGGAYPDVDVSSVAEPPLLDKSPPPLVELDGWLQSDITSLDQLEGRVVIVQFWTYSCRNCTATIPYLQGLYERYGDEGLEIVGVHSPEFDFEKDPEGVADAAEELGVTWPIALDTERTNFREWQGRPAYWPRTYVLDERGRVRYNNIGEGAYDQLAETVAWLLAN
jgi:thiol-disulfide isomerase/thioredoxin